MLNIEENIINFYLQGTFPLKKIPDVEDIQLPRAKYGEFKLQFHDEFKNIQFNEWIGGGWSDYPQAWYPPEHFSESIDSSEIGSVNNIRYEDGCGLYLFVTPNDKVSVHKWKKGIISKVLPGMGLYRLLCSFEYLEGLSNAFWLWKGFGSPTGGNIEYDFEHKSYEENKIHVADHNGFIYQGDLIRHSHYNIRRNNSLSLCDRYHWLEFYITPWETEWYVDGILVKRIYKKGSTENIEVIIGTGTGGINEKPVQEWCLPAGMFAKKFEYYYESFNL
jgi:beta-glucanase (GH16 family)